MIEHSSRKVLCALLVLASAAALTACGSSEPAAAPVATPGVTLNHERAPAGSPLEITYRFAVAADAAFAENYRVMAHVVDSDGELMWTDDHEPPVPTSQWKPGETVQYTRTLFVPVFPYVGEAAIHVGLYSCPTPPTCEGAGARLPLAGDDVGQRAYRVGRMQLLPQTDNLLTIFKDGWHPAEVAGNNTAIEWQWTKQEATLAFKNPKKDAVFYLEADSPGGEYHGVQRVQVVLGNQVLEEFALEPEQRVLRKVTLPAAQLGAGELAELQIRVDKTFIPAQVPSANSKDSRELGVRVFHAFVDPR